MTVIFVSFVPFDPGGIAPPRAFFTRVDTVLGMDHFSSGLGVCNFVEDNISLTLVNYMPLGTDHFDSGLSVRNLTQTHLLKPSELTHKLPRDVVKASIPVLSCGITNGSTCADQTQMVTKPWASGLCVLVFWRRDAGPSLAENETRPEMECNLDEDTAAVE